LSSGVSSLRGWKVSPILTFLPPSHQRASWESNTVC
jgi:hypothetical protein